MKFREQESQARQLSQRLILLFMLLVLSMVFITNGALALTWRLFMGSLPLPLGFFATNTLLVILYIFGSWAIERACLKNKGGAALAERAGGMEISKPDNIYEQRLCNIVMEVAVATAIKPPQVFLLNREEGINAFAAGWTTQDAVIAVTRGATERLTRSELQGVVAHEFAHILNGDMRLNMQLMSMVIGLQMIYNYGHDMAENAFDFSERKLLNFLSPLAFVVGHVLMLVGWLGWISGVILSAAVSRQREYLADALAVKYTRYAEGLAGALRKIAYQLQENRAKLSGQDIAPLAPLFLHFELESKWFSTHPSIAQRLKNLGFSYRKFELKDSIQKVKSEQFIPDRLLGANAFTPHLKMMAARWGGLSPQLEMEQKEKIAQPIDVPQGQQIAELQAELYLSAIQAKLSQPLLKVALLAFWVPTNNAMQEQKWVEICTCLGYEQIPYRVLTSVQNLSLTQREPFFEKLSLQIQNSSLDERTQIADMAKTLYDNQPQHQSFEWLRLAVFSYWMGEFRETMSNDYSNLSDIQNAIALITSFIAKEVSVNNPQQWTTQVLSSLELDASFHQEMTETQLNAAIKDIHDGVSSFAPILIKTWLHHWKKEAKSCNTPQFAHAMDVFRLICALLDTICPREIEQFYTA